MSQMNYKQEVTDATKDIDLFVDLSVNLTIQDDERLKFASNALLDIKTKAKEIKAKKKAILDPLAAAVKEVKELFADPEKRLADAEAAVKQAMIVYHDQKEVAAQKKMEQINGRLERGTMKVQTGIAKLSNVDQAESSLQTESGSVQFKQGQEKLRITDAAKLIEAYPEILQSERVLEALRLEATAIYKQRTYVLPGTEVYRDKIVAGVGV